MVKGKHIENDYYIETVSIVESSSDFQQAIIYTGKEGNIIKATYREFSGGLARPAFAIDVTYDLNDSDIIAFRGARLQIIKATNTEITYKVISNIYPSLPKSQSPEKSPQTARSASQHMILRFL